MKVNDIRLLRSLFPSADKEDVELLFSLAPFDFYFVDKDLRREYANSSIFELNIDGPRVGFRCVISCDCLFLSVVPYSMETMLPFGLYRFEGYIGVDMFTQLFYTANYLGIDKFDGNFI